MISNPIHSTLVEDPDFAELVSEFVSNVPERIRAIRQCIDSNDTKQLCTLVHQLKGACGSYGFHEITPIAASLEARIRSEAEISSLLESLEVFIATCLRMTADPA